MTNQIARNAILADLEDDRRKFAAREAAIEREKAAAVLNAASPAITIATLTQQLASGATISQIEQAQVFNLLQAIMASTGFPLLSPQMTVGMPPMPRVPPAAQTADVGAAPAKPTTKAQVAPPVGSSAAISTLPEDALNAPPVLLNLPPLAPPAIPAVFNSLRFA